MSEKYEYMDKKKLLKKLDTSLSGLSIKDVEKRIKKYGFNELPKSKKKTVFEVFLSTLNDPIIFVLIVAMILSFVGKEVIDGIAIIFIILVDSVVSTIQELNAEKNSEALMNLIKVMVKVIRDDKYYEIESKELVPGDIVIIEPGTKISADLRLLNETNITADESILTGESVGVVKDVKANRVNMENSSSIMYAGTSVLTGRGLGVVIYTGINTELGKIANKVTTTEESKSPLTIRMEKFSRQISLIIVIIAIIIACVLFYKDYPPIDIFLSVVALAVSAMPEGLPLALTMALTIGSNRMAKKNVIVKKLNSVESLGSCTVIASDKTGTLTVNEQTAKKIVLPNGKSFEIDGNGYEVSGRIKPLGKYKIEDAYYISKLGVINNEAIFEYEDRDWKHFGDSIDVAFKVLGAKTKVDVTEIVNLYSIPYESEKKYSSLFYKDNKLARCTCKGSLETILEFCKYEVSNKGNIKIDKQKIIEQNEELASEGYRVIAICDGEVELKSKYSESDLKDLTFVGLVAFIDPVRREAIDSIRKCKQAGIKVIMITGDHALTAYAIAKELKIVDSKDEVITGSDLNLYSNDEEKFDKFIRGKKVFARISPLEKLKIVESLQRQGEYVAVTGDGVNDAPALKVANIGVAMGSGTDVAKETAKMIIIDDNFKSIVAGIAEGRNAYSNIRKISILLLSCGFAEVLFFVLAILFNMPLPLVAIQLLWLNLVTNGLQDISLSFEVELDEIMHYGPRPTNESILESELVKQTLLSGLYMGIIVFVVWFFLLKVFNLDASIARGYVLALMVFLQNIHVLNCRSESKSVFINGFKNNKFVLFTIAGTILLQIIVMEVPVLSSFLQTSNIPYSHLVILFVISISMIFVMELYKYLKFHKRLSKM